MHRYQLSPHVYLEAFDEDAVLLVADRAVMITVDRFAASLFDQARDSVGNRPFGRADCIAFLIVHYALSPREAEGQMRALLGFSLRHGLVRCVPATEARPMTTGDRSA